MCSKYDGGCHDRNREHGRLRRSRACDMQACRAGSGVQGLGLGFGALLVRGLGCPGKGRGMCQRLPKNLEANSSDSVS